MAKPEVQALMSVQQKAAVEARYAALFKNLNLTPAQADVFLAPRPGEELYHTATDPLQLKNLAADPDRLEAAAGVDLPHEGLVFEVAFEGLQRSTRHKSGVAMRFPRINRIRWDKPAGEADDIAVLERLLETIEAGR